MELKDKKEEKYTRDLIKKLNECFHSRKSKYFAKSKCYLKYQNIAEPKEKICSSKQKDYYELDILIFEKDKKCKKKCDMNVKCDCNGEPLVGIEVKAEKFITHDVIVYSDKAKRHKILYPHLRYGFIVINPEKNVKLTYKYFAHCDNFDFAYLYNEEDFQTFFEKIILEEINEAINKKNRLYKRNEVKNIKGYRNKIDIINV